MFDRQRALDMRAQGMSYPADRAGAGRGLRDRRARDRGPVQNARRRRDAKRVKPGPHHQLGCAIQKVKVMDRGPADCGHETQRAHVPQEIAARLRLHLTPRVTWGESAATFRKPHLTGQSLPIFGLRGGCGVG